MRRPKRFHFRGEVGLMPARGQFPHSSASAAPAPPVELARAAWLVIVLMTEWHLR
jgi:hypothetical protein